MRLRCCPRPLLNGAPLGGTFSTALARFKVAAATPRLHGTAQLSKFATRRRRAMC